MRVRALFLSACAGTALFGIGAGGAPAATLWTSAAHTTRVTVGATATMTGSNIKFTSGTSVINACSHSSLNLTVTQNNDTAVVETLTGGSFNGCAPFAQTITFPVTITETGIGTVISPTKTCWHTFLHTHVIHLGPAGSYHTFGAPGTRCQSTAGAPVTLELNSAGPYSGPLSGNARLDASYVLTGAAAAWSFTN